MPIVAADIELRYSGGASNTSAAAALGGAMSTVAGGVIDDNVANDLFDNVSSAEAAAGSTEYRGFYVKNNHGTITLTSAKIWISSLTSSTGDEFDIAIADEAKNTTIETIANETTAPVGPTFSRPTTSGTALAIADLAAGEYRGVWIRRTVTAGASSVANNTGTLSVAGDFVG
jgi:hypothetical protein